MIQYLEETKRCLTDKMLFLQSQVLTELLLRMWH